jgi:glutamine synthetase
VIQEENGKIKHFELKTVDASSNPYLAMGAVIAAGLHGIQEKMRLEEPVQNDPAALSPEERDEKGIIPLPGNLGDAIDALGKDKTISDAMGPELSRSYLAVKKTEYEDLQAMHSQKEVELLLEKY